MPTVIWTFFSRAVAVAAECIRWRSHRTRSRTRAFFVHVDVSSRSHPLAEFAARLLPIEPPRGVNDTVPAPPALAFGDVDGDGWPEAVLGGVLLHLGPSFADEEVVAARTYAAFTIGASPEVSAGTGGHCCRSGRRLACVRGGQQQQQQ